MFAKTLANIEEILYLHASGTAHENNTADHQTYYANFDKFLSHDKQEAITVTESSILTRSWASAAGLRV